MRGDIIKNFLIINFDDNSTKILLISKSKKQYYINYEFNYDKNINDLLEDNEYIDEITSIIKNNIKLKLKNIYFNIQNDEIIIRNIKSIPTKKKKEIISLIKYEINQYMPINLQDYIIEYKKIVDYQNNKMIQGIIFPKKFVYICNDISEKLKIRKNYLHINFDILQKMLNMKLLQMKNETNKKLLLIENRQFDMILNEIHNNKIIESYILNKIEKTNFKDICNKENIYYFGIEDEYIKGMNINKLSIENVLLTKQKDKNTTDQTINYLCTWGMII